MTKVFSERKQFFIKKTRNLTVKTMSATKHSIKRATVLGGGAFGTSLAQVLFYFVILVFRY